MKKKKQGFWSSFLGGLTALAGLISAATGLMAALGKIDFSKLPGFSLGTHRESPAPAQAKLFRDDFMGDTLSRSWQVVAGKWYVENGTLHGIGKHYEPEREWGILTLNAQVPSEVRVDLKICILEGALGELMFHLSENRYVRIYLYKVEDALHFGSGTFIQAQDPEDSDSEIFERMGGGETLKQHPYPVKLKEWYSLSVEYQDREYTVRVGGQTIFKHKDRDKALQSYGTIGLTANGHILFDDVEISKVSGL